MTADAKGRPKYLRAADVVRAQIADGTLRPGQPAPSGAALSRITGYSTLTCRRALRTLIADGVLAPGPSRSARPRVAGAAQHPGQRDLASAGRTLAAALSARRRDNGLTQPELAARVGVSVTTVGHAETGRLWQSRRFWERADVTLGADGALLRLHDVYRAASAAEHGAEEQHGSQGPRLDTGETAGSREPGRSQEVPRQRSRGPAAPARVTIIWNDGSVTTVHPPDASVGRAAVITDAPAGDSSETAPTA